MKINQIIVNESSAGASVAGSVATVAKPLGEIQKRTEVKGLKPVADLPKIKKKGPYANSLISEGKVKELSMDLTGKDQLSDNEFNKKYGKTKQQMRQMLKQKPPKQVDEAKLDEEDIILVPGQGKKFKSGFIPHGKSRVDHEVGMAKSDLLQILKNTEIVMMAIKNRSEEEGLEGWVQEKIIKAADYMNTIAEYLEGKEMSEMTGGVIAGGGVGEGTEPLISLENKYNPGELDFRGDPVKVTPIARKALAMLKKATVQDRMTAQDIRNKRDFDDFINYARKTGNLKEQGVAEGKLDEKFASQQQAKLMYATAGGADTGVSKKVAKEFIKKSHGQKVSKLPTKVKKG